MTWLLAMFYLVPAAFATLAFWMVWRLTRLIDLSLSTRRAIFVVLGTLALAPMLCPRASSTLHGYHTVCCWPNPIPRTTFNSRVTQSRLS